MLERSVEESEFDDVEGGPLPKWYVMLAPEGPAREAYLRLAGQMTSAVGGVPTREPHVTIAYFQGQADPDEVTQRLQWVSFRPVVIRARGLFSFSQEPSPLFGHQLLMRVAKTAGLRRLHDDIVAALLPLGLRPTFSWQLARFHLRLARGMPIPPREAIRRLDGRNTSLTFTATQLKVTELDQGTFHEWLRHSV